MSDTVKKGQNGGEFHRKCNQVNFRVLIPLNSVYAFNAAALARLAVRRTWSIVSTQLSVLLLVIRQARPITTPRGQERF